MSSSPIEIDDEAAIVAQARRGDAKAFSELLRRYEGKIFRLALHITQNREDAEDVLQEAFLKAYEHLDQFQGQSKFYTWIVRIAVNQALMKLRKRKSDRSVSLMTPSTRARTRWRGKSRRGTKTRNKGTHAKK